MINYSFLFQIILLIILFNIYFSFIFLFLLKRLDLPLFKSKKSTHELSLENGTYRKYNFN